jgi:hypothetical protein
MWHQIMSLTASSAFAAWVIFFGGAEELEGTLASAFLFHPLAPTVSSSMLKVLAVAMWLSSLAFFLVWLFS